MDILDAVLRWGKVGGGLLSALLLLPALASAELRCYDCHGTQETRDIRPFDAPVRDVSSGGFPGNHRTHLSANATQSDCAPCHPGSAAFHAGHRDGLVSVSSRVNSSPAVTAYNNVTTPFPQYAGNIPGSCSNVNCHFEQPTPDWGSSTLGRSDCSACHGAPPSDGNHPALSGRGGKHGEYIGTGTNSCSACHRDHTTDPDPLAHAREAGKRPLNVQFATAPNNGGSYSGNLNYPNYLPSQNPLRDGICSNIYCHSDGRGGAPTISVKWSDGPGTTKCYSCHKGTLANNNPQDCSDVPGAVWDSVKGYCTPYINMTTNGHSRLVGPQWIRRYPCYYCHSGTLDGSGGITDKKKHVNGTKDVVMAPQWNIVGRPAASYDPVTKNCNNVYCHSDGTSSPDTVRPFAWTTHGTDCNTCHGHPRGSCNVADCHDGRTDATGKTWVLPSTYGNRTSYKWPRGQEWKAAIPMFPNKGPGAARANSHSRHTETNFTCDQCHASTIVNGTCNDCHVDGIPAGSMGEVAHLNAEFHANKGKDVVFKKGGSYNPVTKTCSNTACHTGGTDPQWGGSVNDSVICLNCHGTTGADVDTFGFSIYSAAAKINLTQWVNTGHGRAGTSGAYPASGNPAAGFPGNPCWYCHDNNIIHNDSGNPFRLRQHLQFANRFDKECVYCHMTGSDAECLACHNAEESLAPQLSALPADPAAVWPDGSAAPRPDHTIMADGNTSCSTAPCHFVDPADPTKDLKRHNVGAGIWTDRQKADVKNQYMMMGVCLKCHDDDAGGKCTSCHTPPESNPLKYSLGFDPGTGWIKPQKARASSSHFGYKHYGAFMASGGWNGNGTWKGGKFCWDCHDPHGDGNIYMIQNQVATSTDGTFGIPRSRATVVFTQKQSGLDYAKINAPYNGICNVCHSTGSQHYRADGGDGHNAGRVCTSCHEHRFTDSHADGQACTTCHRDKPVPRHSGFGLPRDCTKCHTGTIGLRMDVMGQFKGTSHHVQLPDGQFANNKHCYACHWEATPEGLIDIRYHEGYNYKNYSTVKNAKVDLVVWKPGARPTYLNSTTAIQFMASKVGTAGERTEVAKLNNHCLSCHNDDNNNSQPFGDCKTPRQYAWDGQSVAARYSQTGTTAWGKYNSTTYPNANQKDKVAKSFSAHGNAVGNAGGFSIANGVDSGIPNTRNGSQNVQCFDCHSSHGSKLVGVTSSYVTFNGSRNGGNLKETQAGKGGYAMSYKASANTAQGSLNPYNAGAGQCFDCHLNQNSGTTPWGYQSTFGASEAIKGYYDAPKFMSPGAAVQQRFPLKGSLSTKGGHLKASSFLNHTTSAHNRINGLCTPCHDPHGVSPTLGTKQQYAVPLLKGTWLTAPYREDGPKMSLENPPSGAPDSNPTTNVRTDQQTFGNLAVSEDDSTFAGLCLRCHAKSNLTDGVTHTWKSQDRIHESVKGWKTANGTIQHNYTCSKCHTPHASALPRLMITNCLDTKHRGGGVSGGQPGSGGPRKFEYWDANYEPHSGSFPRGIDQSGVNCHPGGTWPDNGWNTKTPW
ncbi:CxxxxCH/CxxCH domain-containing protein [Geobacter sp. DSM 9736]|uniref:CxxxxCH/CxxCH domain c-type cytochrome n=1 Tax=Geobacter sp. DSM 9736 TaxID=1277350 RepID=UPI000B512141|nr:CxxxxCH/CxxCH domain-containing protein [Geobacter sp. DSM 9736]SNB47719.1 Geobacter sulfurreducens CxxxxCH...CXXCH domain-containing protein [Geobacter sp. DSM 9736]